MIVSNANDDGLVRDAFLSEHLGLEVRHMDARWLAEDHARMLRALNAIWSPTFVEVKVPVDAPADDLALLCANGFDVVDTAVTLERPRMTEAEAGDVPALRTARVADEQAVVRLARTALTNSRFHRDPNVPLACASQVKEAWVRNYFAGRRGDVMIVAPAGDRAHVDGFLLALSGSDGAMVIDLVAVAKSARRRGLCRAMTIAAQRHCPDAVLLRVGTQGSNHASLQAYQRMGFTIQRTELVLHAHLPRESSDAGVEARCA